jgi:CPA2 family monovalent cation:H+ antiporter-2
LEFRKSRENGEPIQDLKGHIVLIGGHRLGQSIIKALVDIGENFVVVDFDPQIIKSLKDRGVAVIYGDVAEEDVREAAGFSKARLIISTAPSFEDNAVILEVAKNENTKTQVILRAENDVDARSLYDLGADYVLLPYFLGGEYLGRMLEDDKSCHRLLAVKKRDLELLKDRCS